MDHTLDTVIDSDKHFIIDPITRTITNQTNTKNSLIQYDHNSEVFTFKVPREVEGHDMFESDSIQVHYINKGQSDSKPGVYEVIDAEVVVEEESEFVTFSWLISQNATQLTGEITFQIKFICYKDDDPTIPDYIWSTKILSTINVQPGINNADVVVEMNADILALWEEKLFSLSNEGVSNINTAKEKSLRDIEATTNESKHEIALEGQRVKESIPEDYTALSKKMNKVSNAVNGSTSGKVLLISDISPVEHTMGIKVWGKNLFDINRPVRTFEALAHIDGDALVVERTNTTNTPSSAYITLGELAPLIGKTVTLSFKNDSTYEFGLSIIGGTSNTNAINPPNFIGANVSPNSTVKLTFTVPAITGATELRFIIQSKNNDINTGEIYRLSNIQLEEGTEATEYESYIDVSNVNLTRWGKNLCDVAKTKQSVNFSISTEGESLLLERPDTTKTSTVYVPIGELSPLIGKTLTLSLKNECEHAIAIAVGGGSINNLWYAPSSYIGVSVAANSTANKTFTVPAITGATELRFMIQTTANSETEGKSYKISNIQCEVGTEATEYEPYKEPTTYVPNADGVVEGVTSYYPTTTLMTDTTGVVIDCEYNRDINKALGENTGENSSGAKKWDLLGEYTFTEDSPVWSVALTDLPNYTEFTIYGQEITMSVNNADSSIYINDKWVCGNGYSQGAYWRIHICLYDCWHAVLTQGTTGLGNVALLSSNTRTEEDNPATSLVIKNKYGAASFKKGTMVIYGAK